MNAPALLADSEVRRRLQDHPAWTLDGGRIVRTLRFADFADAFGFMTRVALAAERLDHHPDWRNAFDVVTIELSTHVAGGITERDFALAAEIDALA